MMNTAFAKLNSPEAEFTRAKAQSSSALATFLCFDTTPQCDIWLLLSVI